MNKQTTLGIVMVLLVLPFISAEAVSSSDPRPMFDLFYLFVEVIFGNMIFAMFGIAGLLWLIGVASRMSQLTIIFIVGTFVMTYAMGMVGALAAIPFFIISLLYMIGGLLHWINV